MTSITCSLYAVCYDRGNRKEGTMTHTKDTLTVSRDFYKEAHNLVEKNLKLEATNADLLEALLLLVYDADGIPIEYPTRETAYKAIQKAKG